MRKQQLEILIESITPKTFGFCYALTGNVETAQQLFVDAYTVFIIEEKEFISQDELPSGDREQRLSIKRYLFNTFAKYIYQLAQNKERYLITRSESEEILEYGVFYNLKVQQRAVLFLKEKIDLNLVDLQEIFALKRHQLIEFIHNANFSLNADSVQAREDISVDEKTRFQINAFVNRTLPTKQFRSVEDKINADQKFFDYYQFRLRFKEFTKSLIPEGSIDFQVRKNLNLEVLVINEDIFPKERFHTIKKITSFLTSPVVEF